LPANRIENGCGLPVETKPIKAGRHFRTSVLIGVYENLELGRSSPYYEKRWRTYRCLTSFFPIVRSIGRTVTQTVTQ